MCTTCGCGSGETRIEGEGHEHEHEAERERHAHDAPAVLLGHEAAPRLHEPAVVDVLSAAEGLPRSGAELPLEDGLALEQREFDRCMRSEDAAALTDIAFYELRYSGRPAAFLRGFRAIYLGLFFNAMIMASVNLAAIKIAVDMVGEGLITREEAVGSS